ncbi:MAG: PLP-dependent aminotransferase family protein [Rhodospirillales bacterium]|nr:PLP-dependent aminotransferase family protein [Alphaproteobacteria bacterium]MBL6947890.1 PLP-dependent aminotransferase family protein [Rhodospirillales bacterium]
MTIWTPDLSSLQGPRYLAIADALAADLSAGQLSPGDRLPTHRDLAYRLGITVGTVSRAYAEAHRRGLIEGEVGRGTYIRDNNRTGHSFLDLPVSEISPDLYDFTLNLPAKGQADQALAGTLGELSRGGNLSSLLEYQPDGGMHRHRAAGADWLAFTGLDVTPDQVTVTNGAQNGMLVSFAAVARPGDTVLTEFVSYPGIKEVAAMLNLRLVGVDMDEFGLRPDALEEACATHRPKALYCVPTLQNPTSRIMPEDRRREIVDIARKHGLTILEDDVYGLLPKDRLPPIAAIALDITIYITSLSKSIAPGLRVGYLYAPEKFIDPLGFAMRGDCRMATPLMAEIATRWIESGQAKSMSDWQCQEVVRRQALAAEILKGTDFETNPNSYHIWLRLPEPWRAEEFVAQLQARKVAVLPAEAFVVGRGHPPHAVRVCIGPALNLDHLRDGLSIIAETLKTPSRPAQTIV